MAPKRARTAAASSSASSSSQPANAAAPKLTLYGGVPHTTPRSPASGAKSGSPTDYGGERG